MSALSATPAAAAVTVHGSATNPNTCTSTLVPPGQTPPSTLGVTISSDASPQPPHDLDPVTLSNTTVEVRVPANFLQPGIDAGIFGDGQTFPVTVTPVIAGSNTVEATQEFEETTSATVRVVDGAVLPLVATVQLPDTIWQPASAGADIAFTEKSVRVVVVMDLLSVVSQLVLTSDCVPSEERAFIALGSVCPVDGPCGATQPTFTGPPLGVINPSTTMPGPTTLPRTGSSSGYIAFVGLSCVAGGALLLVRRRRDVAR